MYAIIETGGKQYRVEEGATVRIDKLDGDVGSEVKFDRVLAVGGDSTKVGDPTVSGAVVTGQIIDQDRDKKIIVFKIKRRKGYRRKNGHRQHFTAVKITGLTAQ